MILKTRNKKEKDLDVSAVDRLYNKHGFAIFFLPLKGL